MTQEIQTDMTAQEVTALIAKISKEDTVAPPPPPTPETLKGEAFLPASFTAEELVSFQQEDEFCKEHLKKVESGEVAKSIPNYFLDAEGRLCRRSVAGGKLFETLVLPTCLIPAILDVTHHQLGHNGAPRMYEFLKRIYFWPGMVKSIKKAVHACLKCWEMNTVPQKYPLMQLVVPSQPLQLIAMDLIGPFPHSVTGHVYALTIMDMLTSYIWAIPLPNKEASVVIRRFLTEFYEKEGGCLAILSDNGMEFKNKTFAQLALELGMRQVFTSAYHPQGNGKLEAAHRFLKDCVTKYMRMSHLEWDELLSKACAAYNFFLNQHSRESPFFLLRGRDPLTPLNQLLGVK